MKKNVSSSFVVSFSCILKWNLLNEYNVVLFHSYIYYKTEHYKESSQLYKFLYMQYAHRLSEKSDMVSDLNNFPSVFIATYT